MSLRKITGMRFAAALMLAGAPAIGALAIPVAAHAQPEAEAARFTAFIDNEFEQELKLRPQRATALGRKQDNDKWDDISDAGQLQVLEWRRGSVARMKAAFDRAKLPPEARASYDMWAMELDRAELTYRYRRYQPPFYSFLYSIHSELPNFLINTQAVNDLADMRGYNARLKTLGGVLDVGIAESRQSTAAGVTAPKFEIERVIEGSKVMITGQPFTAAGPDSPLWADAKAKVGKLKAAGKVTDAEADALLADARAGVLGIKAPYERVIAWANGELPKAPSGKTGAVSLPGGLEWYAAALKLNTTTDLTPDQVHALGLKEVDRIQKEQDALARKAGFKDRQAFYDDRAKKFPPTPWTDAIRADYLRQYNAAIARNRSLLPSVFNNLPVYRAEVVREPSFSEVAGGAAHASGPNADGTRPGRVYIHMLGVTDDPANITDLMCHEGIPGHVMQGDIQVRQKGVPKFRSAYRYVAYGEGWALYTEYLCKEMGAYTDVASDFFRLDAELFRAARLVTDTGIHAKRWTREQATQYMVDTIGNTKTRAQREVERYFAGPGQANSYKVGHTVWARVRDEAKAKLGAKFDLKAYHDAVLLSGAMPLTVLQRHVSEWIAMQA